jgi:hypothetical protein
MSERQFGDQQAMIQRVLQATDSLSDEEAAARYQQILRQLPPDQAAELNALALSQVNPDERRNLAGQFRQAHHNPQTPFDGYDYDDDDEAASPMGLGRMTARAHEQDPSLLGGMFGGTNSALGGTVGKAALGALAAILMRQMMSGQRGGAAAQGLPMGGMGGDPVDSILGGLLGSGGGRSGGGSYGQPTPGGLDLGSILGGLLGGGSMARSAPQGGGLGSLLGSILGDLADGPNTRSHRK